MSEKPIVAIMYDFDRTLCTKDMQDYSFIPSLGMTESEFWETTNEMWQREHMDSVLAYMYSMVKISKDKGIPLLRENLVSMGKNVELFKGVDGWFDRLNQFGERCGVQIEHYIISSGLKELIEGTSIAKYFKQIYACSFMYENDKAVWPAVAVDFTSKTQFIFMINKGILDIWRNAQINDSMPDEGRPVPFQNMIYLGDGETDIPSMRIVKSEGGHSIAIYKPCNDSSRAQARNLVHRGRVNFACPGDYREGSELYNAVIATIAKVKTGSDFHELERQNQKSMLEE